MKEEQKKYISIYWDEKWNVLQQEKEDGKSINYQYKCDEGEIQYPFIKRVAGIVNDIKYYDLVTARGQGGPRIINAKDKQKLIGKFEYNFQRYCEKENIIAEYIRFDPWIQNFSDFKDVYTIFSEGNIYCNNLNLDFYVEEYSSSVRRNIRKAAKNNIIIKLDYSGETIKDFLNIYNFTEEKYNVSDYYNIDENFIKKYFEILKGKVCIANAYYENKIISSVLFLIGKNIIHYHFAASDPNYSSLQANTYLIYNVALEAKEKNISLFDFGRAKNGSNLEAFKMKFINNNKDKILKYEVGTKIRNKSVYDKLVELRGGKHEGYFPEYR